MEFIFEIKASKDEIYGVSRELSCCHGNLLRHNSASILLSNNSCFIWYHNIVIM